MSTIRDSIRNLTSCVSLKSSFMKSNSRQMPLKVNKSDQFYLNSSSSNISLNSMNSNNITNRNNIAIPEINVKEWKSDKSGSSSCRNSIQQTESFKQNSYSSIEYSLSLDTEIKVSLFI